MGTPGLIAAFALSWVAGMAVLAPLLWNGRATRWQTLAGYGFAAGMVLTTLVMRITFAAKLGLSFGVTAAGLTLVAIAGIGATVLLRRRGFFNATATKEASLLEPSVWGRLLWFLLLALTALRITTLLLEAWWRPLFPWDAWQIWGPKTKIWFETRDLNNLYGHFENGYPPAINLIQVWANLGVGSWDDAKMNLAWPVLLGALALAGYGQARRVGASPLAAAVVAYLLASIPMLDAHAALAGYADLPLAVTFGLAAIAFFVWVVSDDWRQLVLALLFAAMAPLYKIPGIAWSLTLAPALLVAMLGRTPGRKALRWVATIVVAVLASGAYLYAKERNFSLNFYQAHVSVNSSSGFVLDNYFLLDNYHLVWYMTVAALICWWRAAIAAPLRPATTLIAAGVAFLVLSFFFTNSAKWWGDYGSINRATLHLVPALIFYLFLLSRSSLSPSVKTLPA
ncbi:MAG: hypothetical protein ABI537_14515 [Casimicrobiaceae bacterium]